MTQKKHRAARAGARDILVPSASSLHYTSTGTKRMKTKQISKLSAHLAASYEVSDGPKFRIKHFDPEDTAGIKSKEEAQELLDRDLKSLRKLQETLYAQGRWGLLIILQGMDAAGKDSIVKHVMSGVNPQGCDVFSFKTPSNEELDHDYLWRTRNDVPPRGKIGIFNRSYYEEVLVLKVHPKLLNAERLPEKLISKHIWDQRYQDINAFERYLTRNGIILCKFFLHVSKKEQKKRFLERLDDPKKNWKFSMADITERGFWKDYMRAYQDMIQNTATEQAPWYVVPADNKWFARLIVAGAIVDALAQLNLSVPKLDKSKKKELAAVRASLLREK
jgi:PPK2 family polyphosphate:nucleotide phosphotransferase